MSAPAVTSITFDKASYNPGDPITATVNITPGTSIVPSAQTFTGTATDSITGLTGSLSVTFTVDVTNNDPSTVTGSDTGGRTWALVSNTGTVATLTAKA